MKYKRVVVVFLSLFCFCLVFLLFVCFVVVFGFGVFVCMGKGGRNEIA